MKKQFLLYRLLEIPFVYSISQVILLPGAKRMLGNQFQKIFGQSKGLVLDVGCGPTAHTPICSGTIVGIDTNPLYISKYKKCSSASYTTHSKNPITIIGVVSSADALPFKDAMFDESRCLGLLHHLPAESAVYTLKEMMRCTKQGGMIILFDNVWPKRAINRPLAWLIRKYDRGQWVRTEEEFVELINSTFQGSYILNRITYTYSGLEGVIVNINKR